MPAAFARARRGVTLIEMLVVLLVLGLLVSAAWPSFASQLLRAGRVDAVEALTRVRHAQAQFHGLHGLYAGELRQLRGAPQGFSAQGLYRVELHPLGGETYRATAHALGSRRQAADTDCATISVEVGPGYTHFRPTARCWNR